MLENSWMFGIQTNQPSIRHIEINHIYLPFKRDKNYEGNRPEYNLSNSPNQDKQGLTPDIQASRKQYPSQGIPKKKSTPPPIRQASYYILTRSKPYTHADDVM